MNKRFAGFIVASFLEKTLHCKEVEELAEVLSEFRARSGP
jgi:hypothetical protein